ncbi:MAG: CHASE3 domain-containing protein [Acidobacteriaceae bacterium]
MNTKAYTRLLLQLVLLPLLALSLLAVGLGYSLQRMVKSAGWVDHSDRVIAHANRILQLIVDEETGIRGFFLTHDSAFLEPYNRAGLVVPQEFQELSNMVQDSPTQVARAEQLRQAYLRWNALMREDVGSDSIQVIDMAARKQQMVAMRTQLRDFLQAEESLRTERSMTAYHAGVRTRRLAIGFIILIALGIVWITLGSFFQLRRIFSLQLEEAERQRALVAEREVSLNTTLRSIGDGVIACDPAGCVTLMNPVAERLTGWKEQDAKGQPLPKIFQIITENTRTIVENPVEKVRRTGGVVGFANHTILIRKDNSECGIDDSAAPIRGADGRILGIVLVFRDCTERRSSQAALMRAEKLAAAGKLAASIAHEVNNPLEGLTNILYLAGQGEDAAEIQGWLSQAQSEVERLSHITRRTLGFYRENRQPAAYRPSDVVGEVLSFYVPEAQAKNVQLEAQVRTQQQIYGVPGELRQVLSNLIANSLDAMSKGGAIRLVVREVTDLKDSTKTGVRITVADTGCGIPPHILTHVFEPFFTTKLDTGTGLGLWVSKELIEKQCGRLRVRSSSTGRQKGTAFYIYLPLDGVGSEPNGEFDTAISNGTSISANLDLL